MIYSATIIYFDENKKDAVLKVLNHFKAIEIHQTDFNKGKLVITIEAEDTNKIEDIENKLRISDGIIDVVHHAFHFGEAVELMESGEKIPDINAMFKSRKEREGL